MDAYENNVYSLHSWLNENNNDIDNKHKHYENQIRV